MGLKNYIYLLTMAVPSPLELLSRPRLHPPAQGILQAWLLVTRHLGQAEVVVHTGDWTNDHIDTLVIGPMSTLVTGPMSTLVIGPMSTLVIGPTGCFFLLVLPKKYGTF